MKLSVIAALVLQAGWLASHTNAAPSVTIKNGTLTGLHDTTYNHDLFLGIPYAKPPIGNNRFRAPEPYDESWTGTRDAIAYGYSCPGYATSLRYTDGLGIRCLLPLRIIRLFSMKIALP